MKDPLYVVGKRTILVVDDTPENLTVLHTLLKDEYRVKPASSGERALQIAFSGQPPDLVLLDIMMPEMDGYEVLRRLRAEEATREIPVIFLTAKRETEEESRGLALGAVDYITKPISPPIVQARIRNHLHFKIAKDALRGENVGLEHLVQQRTQEIQIVQDVTIRALASLAETRDNETGNHIHRTQHYVRSLAERIRSHPRFAEAIADSDIELLYKTAPLHDIGKVGIPDRILLKPGKLEPEEFELMKTHTTLGYEALVGAEGNLGVVVDFLRYAKEIAYCHHEKWNGAGYPQGLAGDAIPLAARLMAVADVYDALISRRVYKDGMPHQKALTIIAEGRGNHFDPDLVDGFLSIEKEIQDIAARYQDSDEDLALLLARTEAELSA